MIFFSLKNNVKALETFKEAKIATLAVNTDLNSDLGDFKGVYIIQTGVYKVHINLKVGILHIISNLKKVSQTFGLAAPWTNMEVI